MSAYVAALASAPAAAPTTSSVAPTTVVPTTVARARLALTVLRAPVAHRYVPAPTTTSTTQPRYFQTGQASWYQAPAGTCAHPTLPFGTVVTITETSTGHTTTCRVADRGPYMDGRILDMAPDVFSKLEPTSAGVIDVRISWS